MHNFTEDQIRNWFKYERVRRAGAFNMFDPDARLATRLSQEDYLFCMNNYSELREVAESEW